MKRRGFLAGILAAGVAPAIVHNPMKIFVPKQDIVLPRTGRGVIGLLSQLDGAGLSMDFQRASDPGLAVRQIQDKIAEKIRQMSYQLYTESGYVAAAQQIDRLVIPDPKMVQYLVGGHV
jgi:hypothetical protein